MTYIEQNRYLLSLVDSRCRCSLGHALPEQPKKQVKEAGFVGAVLCRHQTNTTIPQQEGARR